jgi:hypothetical protein
MVPDDTDSVDHTTFLTLGGSPAAAIALPDVGLRASPTLALEKAP